MLGVKQTPCVVGALFEYRLSENTQLDWKTADHDISQSGEIQEINCISYNAEFISNSGLNY